MVGPSRGRKPRASALKVMYLSPLGELGGAERALLDLMAALRAANPEWCLDLIAASDGELVTRAREMGVAASVIPLPPVIAATFPFKLSSISTPLMIAARDSRTLRPRTRAPGARYHDSGEPHHEYRDS